MTSIAAGAIELWLLDRDAAAATLGEIEGAKPRLAHDEIGRAGATTDPQQAIAWRAGRTALRLLLERRCDLDLMRQPFGADPSGRPRIPMPSPIDFSLSDSGAFLLIGLANGLDIGVDIELRRPAGVRMPPALLARLLASAAALGACPPATPLQAWTRIEAFAKARRQSLAAALAELGIRGGGADALSADDLYHRAHDLQSATGIAVVDLDFAASLTGACACTRRATLACTQILRVQPLDAAMLRQLA